MRDSASFDISLGWLLNSGVGAYGLFYAATVVLFVLSAYGALKVRPLPTWLLVSSVLLSWLPAWCLFAVSAWEVFGSHRSYWVAAMFVYAWPGVFANMLSTMWLTIYAVRRWRKAKRAARARFS